MIFTKLIEYSKCTNRDKYLRSNLFEYKFGVMPILAAHTVYTAWMNSSWQNANTPDSQLLRSKSRTEIVNPTSHPVPVTKCLSVPKHYETSQYLSFSQISKEISSSTGQYRPVPVLSFLRYLRKFENEISDAVRASSNLAVHVHVHVLNLVNSTARTFQRIFQRPESYYKYMYM